MRLSAAIWDWTVLPQSIKRDDLEQGRKTPPQESGGAPQSLLQGL
jgi:hypothetical protein